MVITEPEEPDKIDEDKEEAKEDGVSELQLDEHDKTDMIMR